MSSKNYNHYRYCFISVPIMTTALCWFWILERKVSFILVSLYFYWNLYLVLCTVLSFFVWTPNLWKVLNLLILTRKRLQNFSHHHQTRQKYTRVFILFMFSKCIICLVNIQTEIFLFISFLKNMKKMVWWRIGFLRILTVAFLLFLAIAGGSNPAGQSFTLT